MKTKEILEGVEQKIDEHTYCVKWNLKNVLRRVFWDEVLKQDNDKPSLGHDIDRLVDIIVDTSRDSGGDESYPVFGNSNGEDEVGRIIERMKSCLELKEEK